MDKLQPVIRHHFWILFLLALILPPIAWSMTTGALDEQTQSREDDLSQTLSGVASGTGAPNSDWTAAATQLVNVRRESNRRAWSRLWDVQEKLQIWPEVVRGYMEDCPYRGTPADVPDAAPDKVHRVMATVPNLYRDDYEREIERVWRIPEPVDEQAGLRAAPDAPQKVLFPSTVIPRVPQARWMAAQPTWKEMWNAQEDLWLMSELLKAIRRTNADATSIADANVRQIRVLQLFGGERAAAGASSGSSSSLSTGGADSTNPYSGMSGMGMQMGRVGGSSGGPTSAEFPLSEEYVVKDGSSGGGGAGGYAASMGSSPLGGTGSASSAGSSSDDSQADENRYIRQEWAYRTRGFKLRLTVHQMYVPTLIAELLKSEFPVEIVRFQQAALNPDRPGGSRGGGYAGNSFAAAGGGIPGGGFPGGSSPGGSFPGADGVGIGGAEAFPGGAEADPAEGLAGAEGYESGGAEFNPYSEGVGGAGGGAAAANNAVNQAIVAAALSDIDMMDIVIVGEIYLYNQPEVSQDSTGAEAVATQGTGSGSSIDPNAGSGLNAGLSPATGPTGAATTGGAGVNPAAGQPAVGAEAGSPAVLTGGVTGADSPAPATLESAVIPAAGVEAPGGNAPGAGAAPVPGSASPAATPAAAPEAPAPGGSPDAQTPQSGPAAPGTP